MSLFGEKYRNETTRLKNWDYSRNAIYLITLVTRDRENYFGEIKNHRMLFSDIGKTAFRFRKAIPDHFPFVVLDEFIIMPDHIYGIIIINKKDDGRNIFSGKEVGTQNLASQLTNQISFFQSLFTIIFPRFLFIPLYPARIRAVWPNRR